MNKLRYIQSITGIRNLTQDGVKGWGINYDELRERNAECERLNESDVVIAGVFGHGSRQELSLVLVINTRVEHVNDVLQSVTTHRHTQFLTHNLKFILKTQLT